jgi:hypothetical protein
MTEPKLINAEEVIATALIVPMNLVAGLADLLTQQVGARDRDAATRGFIFSRALSLDCYALSFSTNLRQLP